MLFHRKHENSALGNDLEREDRFPVARSRRRRTMTPSVPSRQGEVAEMKSQKKQSLEEIRSELKELLVTDLALEDITPEEIEDDGILFGEGLGLDSLDAVEIVVLLQRNYGLEITDEEQAREIFHSMDTMARWVYENLEE